MKNKLNQSVNFTSLTVTYLFDFLIMAAVLCFTSEYLSASPDHTLNPSFVVQQNRAVWPFQFCQTCLTCPPEPAEEHTLQRYLLLGTITFYAKTQLSQEMHTSFWDVWVFKTFIWSILAALWHFYPTKHHVFVLGTEGILFSPSMHAILNFLMGKYVPALTTE